MYGNDAFAGLRQTVAAVGAARTDLASGAELGRALKEVQAAQDALEGIQCELFGVVGG